MHRVGPGLAQNQLPVSTRIENVNPEHVLDVRLRLPARLEKLGQEALRSGSVTVVIFAGGVGSVGPIYNAFCEEAAHVASV